MPDTPHSSSEKSPQNADEESKSASSDVGSEKNENGETSSDDSKGRKKNASAKDTDNDGQNDEASASKEKGGKKSGFFHSRLFKIGAVVILCIALLVALIWWLYARQYESTDDAFIDTHIAFIAPQIAGRVLQVYVADNQPVHAGQLLVAIDASDARTRLAQTRAQKSEAEGEYRQFVYSERGAAAQADNATRELARYQLLQLKAPAAVTSEQLDQAFATAQAAIAQRNALRTQIQQAIARLRTFGAQIASAQVNLGYAVVTSPIEGYIAQKTVAVGSYVSVGQEMMAIVPLQMWITANFKETQLVNMRIGQPATVNVDACGGNEARAHVDSLERGAGQAFGILPPENATGNFVKVVQRVPVKVIIDQLPANCLIGPGMSVELKVKVR